VAAAYAAPRAGGAGSAARPAAAPRAGGRLDEPPRRPGAVGRAADGDAERLAAVVLADALLGVAAVGAGRRARRAARRELGAELAQLAALQLPL